MTRQKIDKKIQKKNIKIIKIICLLFFLTLIQACSTLDCRKLKLSEHSTTDYYIAGNDMATEAESFALKEFKVYLQKVTGAAFKICNERTVPDGIKCIYIGQTEFAKSKGVDFTKLSDEEWLIKTTNDGNLIISGGRPRGVIYGVYEFLEKYAGCRWLDEETEIIPHNPDLTLNIPISLKEKPSFSVRGFYFSKDNDKKNIHNYRLFFLKNKCNYNKLDTSLGFYCAFGSPGRCHTFYYYTKDWPERNNCLFSLSPAGERQRAVTAVGPGQVCMTNPKTREVFIEKLRTFIKTDKELSQKKGHPAPLLYDISQNDNGSFCNCEKCKKIIKKYGTKSGLLIDFINYIANNISVAYPDIQIQTLAYLATETPPNAIRPLDNVIIRIALLGCEFIKNGKDNIHPINHKNNEKARNLIKRWAEIANNISFWDYWVVYEDPFFSPYTNISSIQPDLNFYYKNNVKHIFIESEFPEATTFFELKRWLGQKMMQNPNQDANALINDFMKNYYGNASGVMKEYLDYLEKRMKECCGKFGKLAPENRQYLDMEFFIHTEQLLNEAEALVFEDKTLLEHVRKERIPVDSALLNMWNCLPKKVTTQFNKKKIIQRYRTNLFNAIDFYNNPTRGKKLKEVQKEKMEIFENYPPLSPEFKNKNVKDYIWTVFKERPYVGTKIVKDKDATGGRALKLGTDHPRTSKRDFHQLPLVCRLSDGTSKKLGEKRLFPDQKYHLYKLGKMNIKPDSRLWIHKSNFLGIRLTNAYDPSNEKNEYEIYVSLKVQGTAYVTNSEENNAVFLDRVILVKASE